MSDYEELVAQLRLSEDCFLNCEEDRELFAADGTSLAFGGFWVDIENPGLLERAATAIETLQAENGRLRRLLEAERESLRLAVDENLRPW